MIGYFLLDGYSHATETLVGQAVGARDRLRLDLSVRLASIAAAITGAFIGVVLWFTAGPIIAFMTTNTEVQVQAAAYVAWVAWLPLIAFGCFLLDGVFIGATRTVDMRNMMLVSFVVYLGVLAIALPWLGNPTPQRQPGRQVRLVASGRRIKTRSASSKQMGQAAYSRVARACTRERGEG